jgi:D-alanyl-D-alanine carboxypeptidase (penicillin-binding protein 5/6)
MPSKGDFGLVALDQRGHSDGFGETEQRGDFAASTVSSLIQGSATISAQPNKAMHTKNSSLLSVLLAVAAGVLLPSSATFAAKQAEGKSTASKATAAKKAVTSKKAVPNKKAAPSKKAALAANALPPLAAQVALADNAPALPAKAWLLMDYDSGQVLASANADEALPPASLTKMMTSYIVEQALRTGKLKPTDLVTVSENAWCRGTSAESCMYLPLNSQATVNAEAQRLGMTQTNFVNPTGLPDPAHKASAKDLAILARAIIRDGSEYYPIYAEREFKYNGIKQGNRNALLYTDPSVDGLKTGHTAEAGFCLVTSAKRNEMRLISVILNTHSAQARADQTRELLGWGYSQFEKVTPIQASAVVANAKVSFGKTDAVAAVLGEPWMLTMPRGKSVQTQFELKPGLEAPIAKGAVIGKVVATANGKPVGETLLVAQTEVERSGWLLLAWQKVTHLFGK